jgi:ABC-2 type transport system ATP-binding protein
MNMIAADGLAKTFKIAAKEPGFTATVRHFLKRNYRMVEAVKPCSFVIEPGEIVGFLGPNGAGKTTTLKMLSGLIHPTVGTVTVAGHTPFKREKAFLKTITLVMGNKQQLIWDLPAMDSFRINGAVYDIPAAELKRRIDELAAMLGLDKQLAQSVRKLSLGERMKCELLAALLHHPKVLFLDEPTLGLDINAQTSVRKFLQAYNQQYGATVLLTSHYMADITALCKRVLLIHQGSLIYDGSLDGILDRFAPYREVKLELEREPSDGMLARYGQVESVEGRSARIIVRREVLTETVERMLGELAELGVADLTITDPPIEKIIGDVFLQGVVK